LSTTLASALFDDVTFFDDATLTNVRTTTPTTMPTLTTIEDERQKPFFFGMAPKQAEKMT